MKKDGGDLVNITTLDNIFIELKKHWKNDDF